MAMRPYKELICCEICLILYQLGISNHLHHSQLNKLFIKVL